MCTLIGCFLVMNITRCRRHIQSVFNLIVDILVDILVIFN